VHNLDERSSFPSAGCELVMKGLFLEVIFKSERFVRVQSFGFWCLGGVRSYRLSTLALSLVLGCNNECYLEIVILGCLGLLLATLHSLYLLI
jgi:hypothetical protein